MPVPRATQVKGSSAIETGSPVVTLIASSRRWSKAPPPVSIIPLSTISAASSGGITSSALFIASLAAETKKIRLGTGTVNMPNSHPAAIAGQIAMLDHMLDGRFNFCISPGGLASDAEVFGNLDKNRNEMFVECIDCLLYTSDAADD